MIAWGTISLLTVQEYEQNTCIQTLANAYRMVLQPTKDFTIQHTELGNSNQLEFPGRQAEQGQTARTERVGVSGLSLKALLLCLGFLLLGQVSALLSKPLVTRTEVRTRVMFKRRFQRSKENEELCKNWDLLESIFKAETE